MNIPTIDLAQTGANIVNLRKSAGLSVHALLVVLGFNSPKAIYKWQTGTALPAVDNLIVLTALLHIRINDILVTCNSLRAALRAVTRLHSAAAHMCEAPIQCDCPVDCHSRRHDGAKMQIESNLAHQQKWATSLRKPPNIFSIAQKISACPFSFYLIFTFFSYGTSHLEKRSRWSYYEDTKKE